MTAALDLISATIDADVRGRLAELAAADSGSTVGALQATEIHGNLGSGTHLYRIASAATANGDPSKRWSYILKIFDLPGEGLLEASADERSWDYWRREWLVYRAPWFGTLTGPIGGPKCFDSGEGPDGRLWIAVEDQASLDVRPWPLERFGIVSRHVGEFNASYLDAAARPDDVWLSRNWIQGFADRSAPGIAQLPTATGNPLVAKIYPPGTIDQLTRLWEGRHSLYQLLNELPQTFCHLDVFPRNVFLADPGRSIAIDWAFAGIGPVGQELSAVIGASLTLFEVPPSQAEELESLCMRNYVEGLRTWDWNGSEAEVELGYLISDVLRWGLGGISPVLTLMDPSMHPYIEAGFGQPVAVVADIVAQAIDIEVRRIDRLRRLVNF